MRCQANQVRAKSFRRLADGCGWVLVPDHFHLGLDSSQFGFGRNQGT
jgi:hypothetical protein